MWCGEHWILLEFRIAKTPAQSMVPSGQKANLYNYFPRVSDLHPLIILTATARSRQGLYSVVHLISGGE
jgi:hypothetical protein